MPAAPLAAIVVAFLAAGVMGMAIQRGATCMVAAVDEAIVERRYRRAAALAEAALWVGGLIALTRLTGLIGAPVAHYPAGALTIAGGVSALAHGSTAPACSARSRGSGRGNGRIWQRRSVSIWAA